MAGETLFSGFSQSYWEYMIEPAGNSAYKRLTGTPSWYQAGHRPYAYVNWRSAAWVNDSGDLYLQYYDYSSAAWQTSVSHSYSDGQEGSIRATTADAYHERWRLYINATDGDGKNDVDVLYWRTYPAAYLQQTDGLSAAGKYVMKPDTAKKQYSNPSDDVYAHGSKIYASDFLMARESVGSWNDYS